MIDALVTDRRHDLLGEATATFSRCRTYRYALTRHWQPDANDAGAVAFVMLNPSTADALADDPTIRRCMGFAKAWGFSALLVLNLFALRSPDPRELRKHSDPVGPDNDAVIGRWLNRIAWSPGRTVIAAWGAHSAAGERAERVAEMVCSRGLALNCLGEPTKGGHPRHPLYLPAATELREFAAVVA